MQHTHAWGGIRHLTHMLICTCLPSALPIISHSRAHISTQIHAHARTQTHARTHTQLWLCLGCRCCASRCVRCGWGRAAASQTSLPSLPTSPSPRSTSCQPPSPACMNAGSACPALGLGGCMAVRGVGWGMGGSRPAPPPRTPLAAVRVEVQGRRCRWAERGWGCSAAILL